MDCIFTRPEKRGIFIDVLTSYAIALHDPANYIEVTVAEGQGANTKVGADSAEARMLSLPIGQ